ncbi:unnamed protein product [Paramecium sonneborni]|uniref:Uncharacterized protein n=1 Tax=Paramecium sonneborni TaxID=65129 RepID=A0A8S1K435_9CILI|nr:unnamed protein product [Paramecium sonneborni]
MSLTCRYLYQRNKCSLQQYQYQDPINHFHDNLQKFNQYLVHNNKPILPPIKEYQRHKSYSIQYDSQFYLNLHQKHPYLDKIKPKIKMRTQISQNSELEISLSLQIRKAKLKDISFSRQNYQSNGMQKKEEKIFTLNNLSNSFKNKKQDSNEKYLEEPQQTNKINESQICGWLQLNNEDNY